MCTQASGFLFLSVRFRCVLVFMHMLILGSGCGAGRVTMDFPNARCAGEACETPINAPVGEDVGVAMCGNGIREGGEACDDGVNDGRYETCAPGCTVAPGCGDSVVDPEEECDDGEGNSNRLQGACRGNCVYSICGDNVMEGRESCDDGNLNDGDGCSSRCEAGADQDSDSTLDVEDNCPSTPNPEQVDSDSDGAGDACDPNPQKRNFRLRSKFDVSAQGQSETTLRRHRLQVGVAANAAGSNTSYLLFGGLQFGARHEH
jgi:cysteine-rich repeat protein